MALTDDSNKKTRRSKEKTVEFSQVTEEFQEEVFEEPQEEITEEPVEPAEEEIESVIDLSVTQKRKYRVIGEVDGVLELNTSDMGTVVRLQEDYPELIKLANRITDLKQTGKDEGGFAGLDSMAETIKSIDSEMRALIDHIFDSNVSEVCAPNGTMYDLFNGKFRFEHIIEKLSELYGNRMKKEFSAVRARVSKHTNKYTRK